MNYGKQASNISSGNAIMSAPVIPGLQILDKIGQGGMASVYLAMQESLQRPVAVKILNDPETPGFHERFMNEGRYIAALSHSNIVDVHDVGEADGYYYIIMEYLPDGDLKRRIAGGVEPAKAMEYAAVLAGCLDYLHGQGIVHRDLKPSNILFRGDGNPVITDFGIAKILQQENELTRSGELMGSPCYLSPEQALSSGDIDGRSDLYSLGVIIYEMLTGQLPFSGESFVAVVMAHREQPVPLLPEGLIKYQPIVDQLLAKAPDHRYQSGRELVEEIREFFLAERPEGFDALQVEEPGLESFPMHRNREQLHFDTGVWSSRLLFLLILGGLVTVILLPQKQQELTWIVSDLKQWSWGLAEDWLPRSWTHSVSGEQTRAKSDPQRQVSANLPVKKRMAEVERLTRLADARQKALQLSFPADDSALYYFRQILRLEPENPRAKAGIEQILQWYIQQAQGAIALADLELAARYVSRGRGIDNQHPQLQGLSRQLRGELASPR